MLRQQISYVRQSLIARDKRCFSRFYLSNPSPYFRKLCAGNLRRNILSKNNPHATSFA